MTKPNSKPELPLPFLKNGIAQVALLVRDLDKAVENYWMQFGIGPWHFYTYGKPLVKQMSYQGAAYDGKPLEEAVSLNESTVRLFPDEEQRRRVQDEIGRIARDSGMRLLGPNCIGAFSIPHRTFPVFLGGLTGELFRQFAITISISVVLSGLVALTMTPALCVLMLKREHRQPGRVFSAFNRGFGHATTHYVSGVGWMVRRAGIGVLLFAGMVAVTAALWRATPGSLVPDEDQGFYIAAVILPDGASLQRTDKMVEEVSAAIKSNPFNEHDEAEGWRRGGRPQSGLGSLDGSYVCHVLSDMDRGHPVQACDRGCCARKRFAGFTHEPAVELASRLCRLAPKGLNKVFFADNGSAAVEVALKMSFQYWQQTGQPQKTRFVSLTDAYHGETLGALSVGGCELYREIYRPILFEGFRVQGPDCFRCPYGLHRDHCDAKCFEHLERQVTAAQEQIAAVIIEPLIQGAAGMRIYPPVYLKKLRALCDACHVRRSRPDCISELLDTG